MGHKFEIFSAGCELCKNAIEILRNNICEECEIIEYNLKDPIQEDIQKKIKKYEIKAVPSIIVDEEYKIIGIPDSEEIRKIIANIQGGTSLPEQELILQICCDSLNANYLKVPILSEKYNPFLIFVIEYKNKLIKM